MFQVYKKARSLVVKVSVSIGWPNKRLKRDCQRVAVFVQINMCDYGCYFGFSVLRCQPLNRALCNSGKFRGLIFLDFSGHLFCVVGK
ncbi:hypothetical protein FKA31_17950 [Vibrio anguillarum]|nr:hypothetical protein [Vibrio anguillarum]NNN97819.1 hypothetical protein [Vibrio sp. B4-6]